VNSLTIIPNYIIFSRASDNIAKYAINNIIIIPHFTNHLNHLNLCNPGSDNKAEQLMFKFFLLLNLTAMPLRALKGGNLSWKIYFWKSPNF